MAEAPTYRLVELPNIGDERGWLLVAEQDNHVPFQIKRMFVLHGVPEGAARGYHAHREQHQFLVMLAGTCDIIVDNGAKRETILLDRASLALYAPPMLWLELVNFSQDAICAVLTSDKYDAADYIRDRAEFDKLTAP